MIAADFSQHNDRPFDCFAFTILPYDAWPWDIERDVNQVLPKDLKRSRDLDNEAIKWLRDPRRFHIAITVNLRPTIFWNGPGSVPMQIARDYVANNLQAAVQAGVPLDTISRLKQLKQKAQANSFNVGLFGDIWILTALFAVLTVLICRERRSEIIGWFPDRDDMTNYCDHVWSDFALWTTRAIAEAFSVDMRTTQCSAAAPDRSGSKEHMWFDYLIRAADWIVGAVAAWDRKNNLIPSDQPKYLRMTEDVLASAENIVIFHFNFSEAGMQLRGVEITRMNWFARQLNHLRNGVRRVAHWLGSFRRADAP